VPRGWTAAFRRLRTFLEGRGERVMLRPPVA
jgi:hypothetical protein